MITFGKKTDPNIMRINFHGKDFSYNIGFVFTHNQNKIIVYSWYNWVILTCSLCVTLFAKNKFALIWLS